MSIYRVLYLFILFALVPTVVPAQNLSGEEREAMRTDVDAFEGDWIYQAALDPIDDTDRSFVMTISTDDSGGDRGALSFKCLSDGLNVIVSWGSYFGGDSDDDVLVVYRFDSKPASPRRYWSMFANSNEMAWMPRQEVSDFVADARQNRKVVIRITDPLDGETKTFTYSLNGASSMLDQLSCAR